MFNLKSRTMAVVTSAALAATLGLAGCGSQTATTDEAQDEQTEQVEASDQEVSDEEEADQEATDQEIDPNSTVAKYGLEKAWYGGDEDVTYYFESADQKAGALLVYHTADNTYERWVGVLQLEDGQATIVDDETDEIVSFTVEPTEDDMIAITLVDGTETTLSSLQLSDVALVLDTVDTYAAKVGEEPKTFTAKELGGEFLIHVTTDGDGEIGYTQGDMEMDFGDDAYTHANAGDTIILHAKAGKYDENSQFVKWTKDGEDFSTDVDAEVTVDGDAEFVAVFE